MRIWWSLLFILNIEINNINVEIIYKVVFFFMIGVLKIFRKLKGNFYYVKSLYYNIKCYILRLILDTLFLIRS